MYFGLNWFVLAIIATPVVIGATAIDPKWPVKSVRAIKRALKKDKPGGPNPTAEENKN